MRYIHFRWLFISFLVIGLGACQNSDIPVSQNVSVLSDDGKVEIAEDDILTMLFQTVKADPATSLRIQALNDIAMHYYWGNGDLEKAEKELFHGTAMKSKYDVMEAAFQQASVLDPYDLDVKYSLATVQIMKKKISEALDTYEEILQFDESQLDARVLHALYSKLNGDEEEFQTSFAILKEMNPKQYEAYQTRMDLVETIKAIPLVAEVPADLSAENHAFVVLGFVLSDDGEMQETLLERLKVAKTAAEKYPQSKIIVTGGVLKNGKTEADVMFDWLAENGIEEDRIIKEDLAKDTVENALYSLDIVKREGIEDITVITSASHMRRALVLFHEVNDMMAKKGDKQTNRDISHIVYADIEQEDEVTEKEELAIYRDLIRASGIWQFPGLKR
ncbi:YdcF family protein [Bacillus niameyensis]|uniref:YdcF family protein n=1 Tax=Bacillus niameyensis TaxID=1522308 RepID=UPI0007808D2C|nr:YdcF family protein [Bacillus niameyensis]